MRAHHRLVRRSWVVLATALAAYFGLAIGSGSWESQAQPTPDTTGGGDDIEVTTDVSDDAGSGSGSDAGATDAGATDAGATDGIDMGVDDTKSPDLAADMAASEANQIQVTPTTIRKTPLSWEDIVVVVRKPFLKVRRTELYPFVATTMNDNMVRHYAVGGELAYYLTDVLAIGVEGQYYKRAFREPFDLVARQARRLPTVNEYKWSASLNFHYVPVYGKFAILDKKLVTWEIALTAGIGAGQSEVIPRDTKFPGFTNLLIMPNAGANMRFFISKWLTVNAGIRDYVFVDKFEPTDRAMGVNDTAEAAKANADSSIINNVMFQIGVSFWLPTSFEYTTFR